MTATPPYDENDRILAGEYTLGLLDAEAAAAFEARLSREPELRALYAEWAEDLAGLAEGLDAVPPPEHAKAKIDARLFGAAPLKRPFAGLQGLAWLVGGAVAAALALYVTLGAGLLGQGPEQPGMPDFVAEIASEDGDLALIASIDAETHVLSLERRAGAAPEGRVLELWLIAGEDAPVSLGVLPDADIAQIALGPEMGARAPGGILAISDEPPGGSPTGAPTGSVLATGAVTPI